MKWKYYSYIAQLPQQRSLPPMSCALKGWDRCGLWLNNAARPRCLVPLFAKTARACCQMQLACNVLCPRWPRLLGHAVKCSLLAMSHALVGQDCWGLLYIRLAFPRCQIPCGVTAVQLAIENLVVVACPWSCALIGCDCWGLRSNVCSSAAMSRALVGQDRLACCVQD